MNDNDHRSVVARDSSQERESSMPILLARRWHEIKAQDGKIF